MSIEAGRGEHRVYRVVPKSVDVGPLSPGKHYLGIDAVAWYINKDESWFSDRMASGTLQITLSSGLEKYQAALGTFELKGGAKTAPVFEQPVLPDRNFLGGPIMLNAALTAIKKDTVLAGMLKSAASASLGIVAGMVQTASVTGPAKLLTTAGEDLVSGVRKVLSDTGEKREPLFDFSGFQYALQPGLVIGPEIFVLLHRGTPLNEGQLNIQPTGQLLLPFIGQAFLDDGAWLLLRLRRSDEYSGVRDWYDRAKSLRGKISSLVSDVEGDVISKEEARNRLKPSNTGDSTLFDEFAKLRTTILEDGVLSERQAGLYVGQLNAAIVAARRAIDEHSASAFAESTSKLAQHLSAGTHMQGPVGEAFSDQVHAVSVARNGHIESAEREFGPEAVFRTMRFLPNAISSLT